MSEDPMVLDDPEIMALLHVVGHSPVGSLVRAALVWRRERTEVSRILGGAVASFVQASLTQDSLLAGKDPAWILTNYKKQVRREIVRQLDVQFAEFDAYFSELAELRARRR